MDRTMGNILQEESTKKSVLYLASNESLCGCMKMAGVKKDVSLYFYPTVVYPLDASPLLRNLSKGEMERVTDGIIPDNEYNLQKFIDAIQSRWNNVVVWRGLEVEDEILMMLIAKFIPRGSYPLYEVVIDKGKTLSPVEYIYIKELHDNIESAATFIADSQLDVFAHQYDLLLKQDTGLRIRNTSGEIINVSQDYFYPVVYSVLDELTSKGTPLLGTLFLNLMMKGIPYHLTNKVLFTMAVNGLITLRYEESRRKVRSIPVFWKGLCMGKNTIVER